MSNVNEVRIGGGLTRDAETTYLPSGMPVTEFTIATNGARYSAQEQRQIVTTQFTTIEAWGWMAEHIAEMALLKGEAVIVEGELTQREREKKDGTKERKTRVNAFTVTPTRRKQASWGANPQQGKPPQQSATDPWTQQPQDSYGNPPY